MRVGPNVAGVEMNDPSASRGRIDPPFPSVELVPGKQFPPGWWKSGLPGVACASAGVRESGHTLAMAATENCSHLLAQLVRCGDEQPKAQQSHRRRFRYHRHQSGRAMVGFQGLPRVPGMPESGEEAASPLSGMGSFLRGIYPADMLDRPIQDHAGFDGFDAELRQWNACDGNRLRDAGFGALTLSQGHNKKVK